MSAPASALEHQLEFETLIANISGRLLAAPKLEIDRAVEAALGEVRQFFHADRCALIAFGQGDAVVSHMACAEGVSLLPHTSRPTDFPWSHQKLVVEQVPIPIATMGELPDQAAPDRASFERMGIRSNLAIPIVVGAAVTNLIVIHSVGQERTWPAAYVPRLRLLGEILVNALRRKQAHLVLTRALEELRESEERFRTMANTAPVLIWMTGTDKLCTFVNKFWLDFTGRTFEQELGSGWVAGIHPDDVEECLRVYGHAFDAWVPFTTEFRVKRKDGGYAWLLDSGVPSFDTDGTFLGYIGSCIDITWRREATDALARSEEQFRQSAEKAQQSHRKFRRLYESMRDAFVIADLEGRILEFNSLYQQMLGYSEHELLAMTYLELTPERWHANEARILEEEVQGRGYSDVYEKEYRHKDGTVFPVELRRYLIRDDEGRPTGMWAIVRDITARKRLKTELRDSLEEVRRLRDRLKDENVYLQQEARQRHGAELVVGRSAPIRRALALAGQVSATPSTVLLLGETGTGKERFATLIHENSKRHGSTMIRVNCAAIPSALIESELFGREKGAYTGALSKQVGRFELANGSTLFLDEIGDLPAEVQVKLLRVLEERTIERLGNPRPVSVDVRIIAATHRDLERAVEDGTFRRDLYYRLNVFPITVPPLRERAEDIPLLIDTFVEEFSAVMGRRIQTVAPESLQALVTYAWPGNVRELRNAVERAMILVTGPTLSIELPVSTTHAPAVHAGLKAAERSHILAALESSGWRIRGSGGAAERLGLPATTLEARMKRLSLRRPGAPIHS